MKFFLPKTAWAYIVNCCIMRIVTITNFNYFTPKISFCELYWNVKYIQYHNSISFAFWPNHRYSKTFYLDVVARCIIDLWLLMIQIQDWGQGQANQKKREQYINSLPLQQIPNLSETIDLPFLLVTIFIIHIHFSCR